MNELKQKLAKKQGFSSWNFMLANSMKLDIAIAICDLCSEYEELIAAQKVMNNLQASRIKELQTMIK